MRLSLVVPCYNEEACLPELLRRTTEVCRATVGDSYEIVLIDDGSRDGTWPAIERASAADSHLVGVRLFRNHGHQLAVTAGISVSRGERVMLIDGDLQDPPEALPAMMRLMDDEKADVVYGQRLHRKGETFFKTATAFLFYRLLNRLSPVAIPHDTGDFRLMTRKVADFLTLMPERHRFLRGMVSWIGGRQVAYPYERDPRYAGTTGYPLNKMIGFALDAITSFSIVPLRLAVWLGAITSFVAFLVLLYAIYENLAGYVVPGWTSSVVTTAFFSGIQLLVLGIIGEYLGRSVDELKGRPLFMIGAISQSGALHGLPETFSRCPPAEQRKIIAALHGSGPSEGASA